MIDKVAQWSTSVNREDKPALLVGMARFTLGLEVVSSQSQRTHHTQRNVLSHRTHRFCLRCARCVRNDAYTLRLVGNHNLGSGGRCPWGEMSRSPIFRLVMGAEHAGRRTWQRAGGVVAAVPVITDAVPLVISPIVTDPERADVSAPIFFLYTCP